MDKYTVSIIYGKYIRVANVFRVLLCILKSVEDIKAHTCINFASFLEFCMGMGLIFQSGLVLLIMTVQFNSFY